VIPDTVLCRVVGLQFGLQTLHGPMSAYTAKADQFDARLSVSLCPKADIPAAADGPKREPK